MKHDPELIRHILDHVAHRASGPELSAIPSPDGHSAESVAHHAALLKEHNLLEGTTHAVHGLTEKGHALRRALHDKEVMARIKHAGEHLGEDATIHIVLDIAKAFLLGL